MRRPSYEKPAMNTETNKGAWSKPEDDKLIAYILKHGEGCWRTLPQAAGLLRCGKSCRLRWVNYLKPGLKRGNFSEDEEDLIIKLHALLGNRWSLIAGRLPGRTDNEVKNYWNTHLKRKLLKMGIDPNKHRLHHALPRLRASEHSSKPETTNDTKNSSLRGESDNKGQISNSGSCLLEDCSSETTTNREMPDLNLDLTTVMDSSPSSTGISSIVKDEHQGSWNDQPILLREIHETTSPTLLLFT